MIVAATGGSTSSLPVTMGTPGEIVEHGRIILCQEVLIFDKFTLIAQISQLKKNDGSMFIVLMLLFLTCLVIVLMLYDPKVLVLTLLVLMLFVIQL